MFGVWLVRVTPEALFYKITNVLVLLIGIILTYQGVQQLLLAAQLSECAGNARAKKIPGRFAAGDDQNNLN